MSVFEPKTLTLRDGAAVSLRTPVEDDAPQLIEYLDAMRKETTGILFAPEDPLPTVEWERNWVRGRREGRGVMILTEDDAGQIVSLCSVEPGGRSRTAHRGEVGISLRAAWCDRGLGTQLMDELVAWSEAQPDLDLLTLCVYADNPRAIRVYEKVGFVHEGRRRWHIKRDGQYVDQIEMSRWVGGDPEPASTADKPVV
ncbi:MAG: GNAT family protein [Planctomycetota bacterium]